MAMSTEQKGYERALNDVRTLIHNATANGDRQHWDYELEDQLIQLAEAEGVVLPDE